MSEEAGEPKKRRRVRIWHILAVLVVILIGTLVVLQWHWKRALRSHIAARVAAGYPMEPAEIAAWYPAPTTGENGAQAFLDACQGYVDQLSRGENRSLEQMQNRLTRRAVIDDETRAALKRIVSDNQAVLERLHAAAQFSQYHYDVDWSQTTGWDIAPLRETWQALRLLDYAATLAFEEGRSDDAIDSIVTSLTLTRSFVQIPTFSAFMRGVVSRDGGLQVLERGTHRTVLTDEQLQRVQAALWADDTPVLLERALASHACLSVPPMQDPLSRQSADEYRFPALVVEAYTALGLTARETDIFLKVLETYVEVTRRPPHEWLAELDRIDAAGENKAAGCLLFAYEGGFDFSHVFKRYLQGKARLHATQAAIAIERYWLAHGDLPDSLADLVPEYLVAVPKDPYTARELRYEKLGKGGFVVYSVGEDGHDDGGWETPPRGQQASGQTYDITFTVER